MRHYDIAFYILENGNEPAKEFILQLEPKMQAKVLKMLDLLALNGPQLRMPYSKYLSNGIFEIRIKIGTSNSRILYFFVTGEKIILTNGFIKKTQKTPRSELEKAINYKKDYERRHKND